jgi:hypothetical protein
MGKTAPTFKSLKHPYQVFIGLMAFIPMPGTAEDTPRAMAARGAYFALQACVGVGVHIYHLCLLSIHKKGLSFQIAFLHPLSLVLIPILYSFSSPLFRHNEAFPDDIARLPFCADGQVHSVHKDNRPRHGHDTQIRYVCRRRNVGPVALSSVPCCASFTHICSQATGALA